MPAPNPNNRLGMKLALIVGAMVLLTFASVPLYAMFCKATGFGGTTQVAKAAPKQITNRRITVRFNTDVAPGLAWHFSPNTPQIAMNVGEVKTVTYKVANQSGANEVGVAVYQVQPDRAGLYFNKIQCFCFNQEPLAAGEVQNLPVQFFVAPEFASDPLLEGVDTITLSYTFFSAKSPKLAEARKSFTAYEQRLIESAKTR